MQEAQAPRVQLAAQRELPGFWRQARWCLRRAAARRARDPGAVFSDYVIFALTGAALGAVSDRGRGSLGKFSVEVRAPPPSEERCSVRIMSCSRVFTAPCCTTANDQAEPLWL